ncbi:MAG TPA: porin family protein [Candidatus Polarisedimenticolaceae bacterium]|nr:porin family protein [Candidatus Polarisedimenticolaceae bacterium]
MRGSLLVACCVWLATTGVDAAGRFYLGGGAGSSSAELSANTRVSFDATGYKGYFGYEATRFLAVEASYTDFGDLDETVNGQRFQGDASTAALWAVGLLPVTPRIGLFGRLGYSAYDTEITVEGSSEPTKTDGNDLAWGFGLWYRFTRSWALRLEWESYRFEESDDVTLTSLSVAFKF